MKTTTTFYAIIAREPGQLTDYIVGVFMPAVGNLPCVNSNLATIEKLFPLIDNHVRTKHHARIAKFEEVPNERN